MKKFKLSKRELTALIISRAQDLEVVDWYLPIETELAISRLQAAIDKYKESVEDYKKYHIGS